MYVWKCRYVYKRYMQRCSWYENVRCNIVNFFAWVRKQSLLLFFNVLGNVYDWLIYFNLCEMIGYPNYDVIVCPSHRNSLWLLEDLLSFFREYISEVMFQRPQAGRSWEKRRSLDVPNFAEFCESGPWTFVRIILDFCPNNSGLLSE